MHHDRFYESHRTGIVAPVLYQEFARLPCPAIPMNRSLVWFRRDLRVSDNTALYRASQHADSVIGLFIITPEQWQQHDEGSGKVAFWLGNLETLSKSLKAKNIPLLIRTVADYSAVPECVQQLALETEASVVHANLEYEVNESRRDAATLRLLAENQIELELYHDRLVVPPENIKTNDGRFYSVYTPYRKQWERIALDHATVLPEPVKQKQLTIQPDPIPTEVAGFDSGRWNKKHWPAGEQEAQRRLDSFSNRINNYQNARDLPALNGTSALSPYLCAGAISPRQCLAAALQVNGGELRAQEGPTVWISELAWRDFYSHVLVGFPRVSKHRPFKEKTNALAWRHDAGEFDKWCRGETGYPIVDAGMRQLNETGWMHNRLRMVTAMFLSKNLLIDWRWGEKYFMQNLLDGDLAANNGGWQWSASTGTDAVPYFRIFSPFSQSKRFDEEGVFIRQYCSELENVPAKALHDEKKLAKEVNRDDIHYAKFIVDYKQSRARALDAFKSLG